MGDKWIFTFGVAGSANITDSAITASRRTVFAAVEDYLQVQSVPVVPGKQFF